MKTGPKRSSVFKIIVTSSKRRITLSMFVSIARGEGLRKVASGDRLNYLDRRESQHRHVDVRLTSRPYTMHRNVLLPLGHDIAKPQKRGHTIPCYREISISQ